MRTVISIGPAPRGDKLKVTLSDGGYFLAKKESDAVAELVEGCEINDEALAFWRTHGGVTAAEAAGMLLGRRSYSERELFDKLTDKGYTPFEAAEAVAKMKEYNLVDDEQYARDLVEVCLAKQRSRRAISETLRQHGIDKELIAELTEELPDQREIVKEIVRRRFGDVSELSREDERRIATFLKGRGFDWRDIAPVIRGYEDY